MGAWLARYLGPEDYGVYSYSIALIGFFGAFTSFGIDTVFIRESVKGELKRNQLFWSGLAIKIFGSTLVFVFVGIGIMFTNNSIETKFLITCISFSLILKSSSIIELFFESRVLMKFSSIARITSVICSSVVKIVFILLEVDLVLFGIVFIIESLVLTMVLIFFIRKFINNIIPFKLNFKILKYLIKNSYHLLFSGIFVTIYMRIDQVMIKELLSQHHLGLYSVTVKLAESINFIPVAIVSSFFPAIVSSRNNKKEYSKRIKTVFIFLIAIATFISLVVNISSEFIVKTLFGEGFTESIPFLNLLIWSSLLVFIGVLISSIFVNEGLQKFIFIVTFIGALSNVILNLFFIPEMGVQGVVFSTLISYSISGIILYLIFPKTRAILIQFFK